MINIKCKCSLVLRLRGKIYCSINFTVGHKLVLSGGLLHDFIKKYCSFAQSLIPDNKRVY